MLLGHCCHCGDNIFEQGCPRIDWRRCTVTELNLSDPPGWNSVGSWVPSDPPDGDSGQIYLYTPDRLYGLNDIIQLPGVRYEPIQFVDSQTYNGANNFYIRWDFVPSHGVPYYPAWDQGSWPSGIGSTTTIRRAGSDHICRTNACIETLGGFFVPLSNRQHLSGGNDPTIANFSRIAKIRMYADGSPSGDYLDMDGKWEVYRTYETGGPNTFTVQAHNVVQIGVTSGGSSTVSNIDWASLEGTAIGIEVFFEVLVGRIRLEGPGDPIDLPNQYPWIHVQPGGPSAVNAVTESSGNLGWVGSYNNDWDIEADSYSFTSLGGPTFPISATAGGEDTDVLNNCYFKVDRVSNVLGTDYAWSLQFLPSGGPDASTGLPPINLRDPILSTAGIIPYLILDVPNDVPDDYIYGSRILYIPDDVTTSHTYSNTRQWMPAFGEPGGNTYFYWQNHGGPFYHAGTTTFVPAFIWQWNTSGSFTPITFTNLPNQIQVAKVARP
jgi:hypothetical protein